MQRCSLLPFICLIVLVAMSPQRCGAGEGDGLPITTLGDLHETASNYYPAGEREIATSSGRPRVPGREAQMKNEREARTETEASVFGVLGLTVLGSLCSAFGAVPFMLLGSLEPAAGALASAMACGVMLAASFDLLHEGLPAGTAAVMLGLCLGAAGMQGMHSVLHGCEEVKFMALAGASARKMALMVGIMTAHTVGEGAGVGVSFSGAHGWPQGCMVALAIGLHNIPEGMATAGVLVARGIHPSAAAAWAVFTSLPQPLLAVPAFMFVDSFRGVLPVGLGFAAGCMLWMVVGELLPDALTDAAPHPVALCVVLAAAAFEGIRALAGAIQVTDLGVRSRPYGLVVDYLPMITRGIVTSAVAWLVVAFALRAVDRPRHGGGHAVAKGFTASLAVGLCGGALAAATLNTTAAGSTLVVRLSAVFVGAVVAAVALRDPGWYAPGRKMHWRTDDGGVSPPAPSRPNGHHSAPMDVEGRGSGHWATPPALSPRDLDAPIYALRIAAVQAALHAIGSLHVGVLQAHKQGSPGARWPWSLGAEVVLRGAAAALPIYINAKSYPRALVGAAVVGAGLPLGVLFVAVAGQCAWLSVLAAVCDGGLATTGMLYYAIQAVRAQRAGAIQGAACGAAASLVCFAFGVLR